MFVNLSTNMAQYITGALASNGFMALWLLLELFSSVSEPVAALQFRVLGQWLRFSSWPMTMAGLGLSHFTFSMNLNPH